MIKLAIAEDHNALIDGIKIFFEYEEDIHFVGFANDGKQLIDLVARKKPDVVISDIRMPVMDGIVATQKLSKDFPEVKVIAFTMFDQDDAVAQMVKAGAKGYILKNANLKEVLEAVRVVGAGGNYYDSNINLETEEETRGKDSILTQRQQEILKLIGRGSTSQEISEKLFISKSTVETHRKNMMRKLELKGSGELLRYAMQKKYDF